MLVWAARKLDCMNFCRGRIRFGFCAKDHECSGGAESKIKIMQLNSIFMNFCSGKASFSFLGPRPWMQRWRRIQKQKYGVDSWGVKILLRVERAFSPWSAIKSRDFSTLTTSGLTMFRSSSGKIKVNTCGNAELRILLMTVIAVLASFFPIKDSFASWKDRSVSENHSVIPDFRLLFWKATKQNIADQHHDRQMLQPRHVVAQAAYQAINWSTNASQKLCPSGAPRHWQCIVEETVSGLNLELSETPIWLMCSALLRASSSTRPLHFSLVCGAQREECSAPFVWSWGFEGLVSVSFFCSGAWVLSFLLFSFSGFSVFFCVLLSSWSKMSSPCSRRECQSIIWCSFRITMVTLNARRSLVGRRLPLILVDTPSTTNSSWHLQEETL